MDALKFTGTLVRAIAVLAGGLILSVPPRVLQAAGCETASFRAPKFGVGIGPLSVAVGDLNDDGKLDLAVANGGSNTVSVLLGTGTGSFGAATNFGVGTGPEFVAVGDFNGDGTLDLAVANAISDNVSILLGTGTGTFGAARNFGAGDVSCLGGGRGLQRRRQPRPGRGQLQHLQRVVLLGTGDRQLRGGRRISAWAIFLPPWRSGTSTATASPTWPWPTATADNVSVLLGNGNGSLRGGGELRGGGTVLSPWRSGTSTATASPTWPWPMPAPTT